MPLVSLREGVGKEYLGNEAVLYGRNGELFTLNEMGSLILDYALHVESEREIVCAIEGEYDCRDFPVALDVRKYLGRLESCGLVTRNN